jgi:hypothetical protein
MGSVYVNEKQGAFLDAKQRYKDIIGGRGSGKTGLIGHHNIDKMKFLPRAKSGLAALTYNQLLNNSLPSMENIWRLSGLVEAKPELKELGHYIVCRKPPEYFAKPLQPPRNYTNVISFLNGFHIQLISMDRPDTVRGMSLDALDVDEKGWVKQDDFTKILSPLVRGNIYEFDHPLHHSNCGFSSMPWLSKQQWILDAEELSKKKPEKYFFIEATAEDNLAVLGPEYLIDAQERLPQIVYLVEYMNHRVKKVSSAFYPAFDDKVHLDDKTWDYDFDEGAGLWLSKVSDVRRDIPLEISYDFNAAFTSMVVCQEHKHGNSTEFRVCDELFVEEATTNLVKDLTANFITAYKNHPVKDLFIYGDRNGNNKQVTGQTFYEQITDMLRAAGFNPYLMVHGLDTSMQNRYRLINDILSEKSAHMPIIRINASKCKYLPIALQLAPMKGEFEKDKSSERPGKGNDQKRATHLTDCLDNIVCPKYKHFLSGEGEYYEAGVA